MKKTIKIFFAIIGVLLLLNLSFALLRAYDSSDRCINDDSPDYLYRLGGGQPIPRYKCSRSENFILALKVPYDILKNIYHKYIPSKP